MRQIPLRLQHQGCRGRTQGIFLLLGIQRLTCQLNGCLARCHAGAVLLHRELRIPNFDAHLVLELLQPHLGLPVFQFGAHLVCLGGPVA